MAPLKPKSNSGFTLIEILVVIAVIGFLAALITVIVHRGAQKGRDAKRIADIKQIDTAIQLYIQDNGHAPYLGALNCRASIPASCSASDTDSNAWGLLAQELSPYLGTLPKDPCGQGCGTEDIWYDYEYRSPASIAKWCVSITCGFDEGQLDQMYSIYAETLEITGGHAGANHGLSADSF